MINETQHGKDTEHLRLLTIFHFIFGGLLIAVIVFLGLHYMLMNHIFSMAEIWNANENSGPPPAELMAIFVWIYFIVGVLLGVVGILNILSGMFLRDRRHRTFSLVVAGLDCLSFPIGTALGAFTIMVLTRDSVREMYESAKI